MAVKLTHQSSYNFTEKRGKKESARDFILQYLDSSHVDIILGLAYDMNLSTEEATAYALAFFNSVQDLFYFHFNFDLGEISVTTTRDDSTQKEKERMWKFRERCVEPYFSNRGHLVQYVFSHLTRIKPKDDVVKLTPQEEAAKRRVSEKKKKQYAIKYAAKQKRRNKKMRSNWEWTRYA